jgi:hypothetical protein
MAATVSPPSPVRSVRACGGSTDDGTVSGVLSVLATSGPRPWSDIPGVAWIGVILGITLLAVAIRSMFGKRDK